ncbi:hypothetical protein [Algisphaera agarilytica]|uniref:DUF3859 domain-containing protein n=1 Tax=Algisphaera agarilytica TaxID=1385975 RepID=A0A7X0H460_9BACT|nr:hypothetical protein [Algisphaera agarilytica]MBB6428963.1 hypothetical protein [Algisphaera agarilytica]
MPTLTVELNGNQTHFVPGERIDGLAGWDFGPDSPKWVEVRLYWHTLGKGDEDIVVADSVRFEEPRGVDAQVFGFVTPAGPFSYEGRLIEIAWGIEVVAHRTKTTAQLDLTLSATGAPLKLESE